MLRVSVRVCVCVRAKSPPVRGGSCSCALDLRCAAERPGNLAQPAPDPFARVCRPPPAGSQARRAPATAAGAAVAAGPKCACVRVAPRRGLAAASRCARPSCGGLVASAVARRHCSSPFFVGEPAGAPAGAQSSLESRPCELRSRLGNSGALVSLVPRATGFQIRSADGLHCPITNDLHMAVCHVLSVL